MLVLPDQVRHAAGRHPLSVYIHVPFCATRCGYCDFNTYTAAELGAHPGASRQAYLDAVDVEIRLAAATLGPHVPPATTVFFGGGTPTLLETDELAGMLDSVAEHIGIADGAEVTTEANPESVDPAKLAALREVGINRLSLGMQSTSPHVLRTLERNHTPGRALDAVRWAKVAGFDSVSLDLIYGTPGESDADWQATLDATVTAEPDHVSAYSLIVEDGTRFAARVRRGELPMPDDDNLASRYEIADDALSAAGYSWYEVSNWAKPGHACQHNIAYWQSDNWWGFGPGAHSHAGGVRWWNAKHPRSYSAALADGRLPLADLEVLTKTERHTERVLLELRLAAGLARSVLPDSAQPAVDKAIEDGLVNLTPDRLVLTRRGRLLADAVVRSLLD